MWDSERGFGRLTSTGYLKDDYFDIYESLEDLPNTDLLYQIRHDLVERYAPGKDVLDFGIGNGAFIRRNPHLKKIYGYDIGTDSCTWLASHDLFKSFYTMEPNPEVVTFWDSLEHLPNLDEVIDLCPKFIICSLPVFENRAEVLQSKHFKPHEHVWYFSIKGLVSFMLERGFNCLYSRDLEGLAGREGIHSFVFERR